jgi:DnaJ-class molecular chaperone
MDEDFVPKKYGMVLCPLCNGKGFLNKGSALNDTYVKSVCTKCGGFGAIRKEEEVFRNVGN